ncbi:hypothetical protein, partial [Oscillibacter sp. UBA6647]|uniref:hypothetical protein n=1 Tax=Oscillibacter sp. UBA6647 TaxID=1947021 RepID=UPI0025F00C6E
QKIHFPDALGLLLSFVHVLLYGERAAEERKVAASDAFPSHRAAVRAFSGPIGFFILGHQTPNRQYHLLKEGAVC